MFLFSIFSFIAAIQVAQPPEVVRADGFQIIVPHGWSASTLTGAFIRLEHSNGASLLLTDRSTGIPVQNLDSFAKLSAERIMNPLGFAKIGEPRHFRNADQQWIEYNICGNRLAEHRRILYRAIKRKAGLLEITYENSDDNFDVLLSEVQAITSSLQTIPRQRPQRSRR